MSGKVLTITSHGVKPKHKPPAAKFASDAANVAEQAYDAGYKAGFEAAMLLVQSRIDEMTNDFGEVLDYLVADEAKS